MDDWSGKMIETKVLDGIQSPETQSSLLTRVHGEEEGSMDWLHCV